MSRFDPPRRNRLLVWTGAALAWGAALTAAKLEPLRAEPAQPVIPQPVVELETTQMASLPKPPAGGLVILRYTPTEMPPAEVRTVYVKQSSPARSSPSVTAPNATPKASAPTPKSGGS